MYKPYSLPETIFWNVENNTKLQFSSLGIMDAIRFELMINMLTRLGKLGVLRGAQEYRVR